MTFHEIGYCLSQLHPMHMRLPLVLRRSAAFEVPSVPQKTNSSPTFTPLCAVLKATPRPIGETGELVVNLDTKTVEMNGCPFRIVIPLNLRMCQHTAFMSRYPEECRYSFGRSMLRLMLPRPTAKK